MPIMDDDAKRAEQARIGSVYAQRDARAGRGHWASAEARYVTSVKQRLFAQGLHRAFGGDLGAVRALDVGCGNGEFLRLLCEWGAQPENLTGSEFLADRLERAAAISHPGIDWHLGDLGGLDAQRFDLVAAHTVFSSILEPDLRRDLAGDIWERLAPGGWVMVFDFRYNNPNNANVCRVRREELGRYWPGARAFYRSGLLAPPLMRRLVGRNHALGEVLTGLLPVLRSHFLYMAQKPVAR